MGVVNEVISQCKDAFTDEGFDEQTLVDLRNLWSRKLKESGVLERPAQMRQTVQYGNLRPGYRPIVTNQRSIQMRQGQGQPQQVQLVYPGVATPTHGQRRIIVQNVQNPNVQTRPVIYQNVVQGQIQQPQRIYVTRADVVGRQRPDPEVHQIDGVADDLSSDDATSSDESQNGSDGDCVDEPALDSNDDDDGPNAEETFDTENVLVCQYEKIQRNKNQWKLYLKDGIMNLNGKDYVFHKATGESNW